MNWYQVTRLVRNSTEMHEEQLLFEAYSFDFYDGQMGPILVFRDDRGVNLAAVDGFEYVEKVEDPQDSEAGDEDPSEVAPIVPDKWTSRIAA